MGAEDNTLAEMECKCGQVLAPLKGLRHSWKDQVGSLTGSWQIQLTYRKRKLGLVFPVIGLRS